VTRPAQCWSNSRDSRLALCAESLSFRQFTGETANERDELIKGLAGALQGSDEAVGTYLQALTPIARYDLYRSVVPQLAAQLSKVIASMGGLEMGPPSRTAEIPDDLPVGLREPLVRFEEKLQRLYTTRLAKGHKRSLNYVSRSMLAPLWFAKHLHANGIDRWDVVRNRDIVKFLSENPTVLKARLSPILRFVNDHLPFRETRGRPTRARGAERRNVTPPAIMPASEIDELLAEIRSSRCDGEYLLAWLVCRLGLMAQTAYALTLDRVQVNAAGRLVIRPAQAWITLPRAIETLFKKSVDEAVPNWQDFEPEGRKTLVFFRHHIPNLDLFTLTALRGKTRILRSSAIFAAMMKGQVDRVTLNKTVGVSMPHIMRLELLLSADMHRSLDPKLVKARNAHILGQSND
jgi:hypothetical protein